MKTHTRSTWGRAKHIGDGFAAAAKPALRNRPLVRSIAGEKAHIGTVLACWLRNNAKTVPMCSVPNECALLPQNRTFVNSQCCLLQNKNSRCKLRITKVKGEG